MIRFSAAGSSGKISGAIGTPAVNQIGSGLDRLNQELSQFAAACRRNKLSRPAPAAMSAAASASRSPRAASTVAPAQYHHTLLGARPHESAPLQPLGK